MLTASTVSSQIVIQTSLDTTSILIGDQINIRYTVSNDKNTEVIFPDIQDSIISKISIVSVSDADTVYSGTDKLTVEKKFLITCFDSGTYIIPEFPFLIKHNGKTDTAFSPTASLYVNSLPQKAEMQDIYDIKSQLSAPYTLKEILMVAIPALLGIAFIVFLIIFFIRKKRNKPFSLISKPVEPAHVIAFRKMEKLDAEKMWQQGRVKEYYTGLTEIVREYIENRFNIPALEKTTDEIIEEMRNVDVPERESSDILKGLLMLADLVKFAKENPLPVENVNNYDRAYKFVESTKKINAE